MLLGLNEHLVTVFVFTLFILLRSPFIHNGGPLRACHAKVAEAVKSICTGWSVIVHMWSLFVIQHADMLLLFECNLLSSFESLLFLLDLNIFPFHIINHWAFREYVFVFFAYIATKIDTW